MPATLTPMKESTCQRLIGHVESVCQRQLVNLTESDLCLGHLPPVSSFSLLWMEQLFFGILYSCLSLKVTGKPHPVGIIE